MKKSKNSLKKDTVKSDNLHVGIELELIARGEGSDEHDDESCSDNYRSNLESDLSSSSVRGLITDYLGMTLDRDTSNAIEQYIDRDALERDILESRMDDWACEDDDCGYHSHNEDSTRDEIEEKLTEMTGNKSIKVVSDGSINKNGDEVDAEVCWNYFISRETLKDNEKILNSLKEQGLKFNTSCGLHINLNNYLKLPELRSVPLNMFDSLFFFVAPSRKTSSYCNRNAISTSEKYSAIYHQGDRLEFRFFSPTLDAEKLNNYVALANFIYNRLCGKKVQLNKKLVEYFLKKIMHVHELSQDEAMKHIEAVSNMPSYYEMLGLPCPSLQKNLINTSTVPLSNEMSALINARLCASEHAEECACSISGEVIEREEVEMS